MTKKLKKPKEKVRKNITKSFNIGRYSFLIKELDELDIKREYERLKAHLSLEEDYKNYDKLARAIDMAAENARVAGMLWASAAKARDEYEEGEFAFEWSDLNEKAMAALEDLRNKGKISGQISENKIKNWIIKHEREKYEELTSKLRELKTIERTLEILKNQWESRKTLLQSQGRMAERKVEIIHGGE